MLRLGAQKIAGYPSVTTDSECRKRAVAAKVTPFDNPGADLFCPPVKADLRDKGAFAVAALVPPFRFGKGKFETRGARAPPWNLA